jgi:hypothetical protein
VGASGLGRARPAGCGVKGRALLGRAAIQAFVHWLARLEMGNMSLGHDDFGTGLWISTRSAWSHSHGERPNTTYSTRSPRAIAAIISSKMG